MYFNLPKRMINITKLVCVIGVVSVAFSSCLQKDVYDPANSGDKEEEVTLDNYFDFATTKNIQLIMERNVLELILKFMLKIRFLMWQKAVRL